MPIYMKRNTNILNNNKITKTKRLNNNKEITQTLADTLKKAHDILNA